MRNWEIGERDRELFARELDSFVPPRIFDAHVHWYRTADFPPDAHPAVCHGGPPEVGAPQFREAMAELMPGREVAALAFPFPHPDVDVDAANRFLADQLSEAPACRGQMLITPAHDPEFIHATVDRYGLVGLKCYHVFSPERPTFQSSIEAFLPEAQVRAANERSLCITLHIVRSRALADPANQKAIRRYCERYPNIKLILAHAARGFNPHHTREGIEALRGLRNLWFDTSVVTDSGAFEAIIQTFGHERLLYGSDFPVSQIRGRCVALGDSFLWISADNTNLDVPYGAIELALVGHESLRSLLVAARSLRLRDDQIEDIFYGNAVRLLQIEDRRA